MAELKSQQELHRLARIVEEPAAVLPPHQVDRTFGLPTLLYGVTVGAYLAFIGVMTIAFANPGLAIPLAICAGFIVAGFGVPTLWTRMNPANSSHATSWSRFTSEGIDTLTGRLSAGEASAQVLVLPILVLCWGITVALIAATV